MMGKLRERLRGPVLAVLLLFGSGMLRAPVEEDVLANLREAGFHPPMRGSSALQEAGVQGMMGALGGLRYMVSTFLTLRGNFHWEFQEWDKVLDYYRIVVLLEPRNPEAWITGAWHCHSNAWAWYLNDDPNHSPAARKVLAREWLERGKELLKEGAKWNPDNPWIYRDLANVYKDRDRDLCQAAEYYRLASETPGAPDFLHRIYGYLLAQCGQQDELAMKVLREIYDQGFEVLRRQGVMIWKPSLIVEMRKLEDRLNIPWDRRIPERFDPEAFVIASPLLPERSLPVYERLLEKDRNAEAPDRALPEIVTKLRAEAQSRPKAKSAVPPDQSLRS